MTSIELVTLAPDAAAEMAAIHAEAFDRPWSAKDFATMMGGSGAAALGVRDGGRLLGFVLLQALAGEAEILTVAVTPQRRRRGVGAALIEAVVQAARAAAAQAVWLEVAVDNTAALGLYQASGFQLAGRRPNYYGRGSGGSVDALVMRRVLNSGAP